MGSYFSTDFQSKEEYVRSFTRNLANDGSVFGGALALGDPDDNYLYRREIRVGLPAKRREIILDEYCSKPNQDFVNCKGNSINVLTRFRCRKEISLRNQCIKNFWNLPDLEERAYNEYLADRSHFRRTGESKIPTTYMDQFSLKRKTWEQYVETKDENPSLWELLTSTIWGGRKSTGAPVQVESEPLNDS